MDATSFELTVSVSQDLRYATTVREVVMCAAQYAGCPLVNATAFAGAVEEAVRVSLQETGEAMLPITVRRHQGPIEVLVNGHTLTLPLPV